MPLLKVCQSGDSLPLFWTLLTNYEKGIPQFTWDKRVLLSIVLHFFGLRRLILRKTTLLQYSLDFSDSQNYENAIKHSLIRARKIHESVLYQAFFCIFFELAKNEEGLEFSFLDSLNLYKNEGRGFHSHVFTSWQQVLSPCTKHQF